MDKDIILELSRSCEELNGIVAKVYEEHQMLVEFSKNTSLKLFAIETILIDLNIFSRNELEQRYNAVLENLNHNED